MIVKIFKSNNPLAAILVPIVVSVFWILAYYTGSYDEGIEFTNFGLDLFIVLRNFFNDYPLLEIIGGIILVSFQAIFLNQIFNRNEFYEKNIYLPSMIYAVLISSAPGIHFISPLLLANTFVIIALNFIYKIKRQDDAKNQIFMTSFLLGIASCLYPPYLLLFTIPFAALIIIRPFVLKEYLLGIIGSLIPWVYFFSFTYLSNKDMLFNIFSSFQVNEALNLSYFNDYFYLKAGLIGILVIILLQGFVLWRRSLHLSGLRFKRLNQLNTYFFLLGFILAILEISVSQIKFNVLILVIPLTLILPFGVTGGKSTFLSSLLWNVFIVVAIINIILL